VPGIGHLRAGRPAGKVGPFYREELRSLRPIVFRNSEGNIAR
jgi:hypothetical protein